MVSESSQDSGKVGRQHGQRIARRHVVIRTPDVHDEKQHLPICYTDTIVELGDVLPASISPIARMPAYIMRRVAGSVHFSRHMLLCVVLPKAFVGHRVVVLS